MKDFKTHWTAVWRLTDKLFDSQLGPALVPVLLISLLTQATFGQVDERVGAYPESLKLAEQYQVFVLRSKKVSEKLARDIHPTFFVGALAPRFINKAEWDPCCLKGGFRDPRRFYSEITWNRWQDVILNRVQPFALSNAPLTMEQILRWNIDGMSGTERPYDTYGWIYQGRRAGGNNTRDVALTGAEVAVIENFRFIGETEPALKWQPIVCAEDAGSRLKSLDWNEDCLRGLKETKDAMAQASASGQAVSPILLNELAAYQNQNLSSLSHVLECYPRPTEHDRELMKKRDRYCGYFIYGAEKNAEGRLNAIFDRIQSYLLSRTLSEDPFVFALRMQQQFVALHALPDGNGRASRQIMDVIALRLGLPPIVPSEMSKDIAIEPHRFAAESKARTQAALDLIDSCLKKYESLNRNDHDFLSRWEKLQHTQCAIATELVQKPVIK